MIVKDQVIKNKSGVVQVDKYGKPLHVGQPVLIMDKVHNGGSRGSVSTGIVAGFDRYMVVLKDGSDMVEDNDLNAEIHFLNDKANKLTRTWKYDYQERNNRLMDHPLTLTAEHLIGCTEQVREGWRDGSLFE